MTDVLAKIFDYQPDADIGIIRDVSTNGSETFTLQIDTKFPVSADFVTDLAPALKARDWQAVYGLVYGYAQTTLDSGGVAHAMLQAACGVQVVDAAQAAALRRIRRMEFSP